MTKKLEKGVYVNSGAVKKKLLDVYASRNGWIWFVTKKSKIIYFGFVHGLYDEWGSFYAHEMNSPDIYRVPESQWGDLPYVEIVS